MPAPRSRKIDMLWRAKDTHTSCSLKQAAPRASLSFPAQHPLGSPEDPGAAQLRTQLVSRRLRFATRAHVQASSRKTHQNINDRQLLNDYDYSGMWVAMTIETVLQFRHSCLRC